jgi:hypothetical protein
MNHPVIVAQHARPPAPPTSSPTVPGPRSLRRQLLRADGLRRALPVDDRRRTDLLVVRDRVGESLARMFAVPAPG